MADGQGVRSAGEDLQPSVGELGCHLPGVSGGDVLVVGSRHEQQSVAEPVQSGQVAWGVFVQALPQGGEITG
ncbi:hypothetical protein [Streptomyces sp. NPDC057002]|uniref:hypothetical protein n=1 Tax=Streptomyces sp. NPDC057002 TaxID=3345992 RepID=UPI00363F2AED